MIDAEEKKKLHSAMWIQTRPTAYALDTAIGEVASAPDLITIHYDMLHLAPPQSAPDFIKQSPFAYSEGPNKGWLEVDIHTFATCEI